LAELVQRRGQAGAAAGPAALRRYRPRQHRLFLDHGDPAARGARIRGARPRGRPDGLHRRRALREGALAGPEPARQAREVRAARAPGRGGAGGPRRGGASGGGGGGGARARDSTWGGEGAAGAALSLPYLQNTGGGFTLVVRADGAHGAAAAAMRAAMQATNP